MNPLDNFHDIKRKADLEKDGMKRNTKEVLSSHGLTHSSLLKVVMCTLGGKFLKNDTRVIDVTSKYHFAE